MADKMAWKTRFALFPTTVGHDEKTGMPKKIHFEFYEARSYIDAKREWRTDRRLPGATEIYSFSQGSDYFADNY